MVDIIFYINKKNFKKYNFFKMIVVIFLCSCSNRKDFISSLDVKPVIQIKENDSIYSSYQDSVKINPNLKRFSSIDLVFEGKDGISNLNYNKISGNGILEYKNDTILNKTLNPLNGEIIIKYIPLSEGLAQYHFIVNDRFQGSDSCSFNILSFKNLPPIAKCVVTPLKAVDPLEYSIDASTSYDQDQHFGGGITNYIFFVNGETIHTNSPIIKYIFPNTGQYSISIQVVDNDNSLSNVFNVSELIN